MNLSQFNFGFNYFVSASRNVVKTSHKCCNCMGDVEEPESEWFSASGGAEDDEEPCRLLRHLVHSSE